MIISYVRRGCGAVFIALVIAACGGGDGPTDNDDDDDDDCPGAPGCPDDPVPVVTTSVAVRNNNTFNPDYIRVSPGATVTFTWEGTTSEPHNINFTNPGIDDAGDRTTGTHEATMPTAAGPYDYTCTNHSGMDGRVLVQ